MGGEVIRESRDVAFWRDVIDDPAVKPHVGLGLDIDLETLLGDLRVVPLRAQNGGFMFVQLDGLGRIYELHTMFKPAGWGREVLLALKAAVTEMFARGAHLITTYEVESNWRSKPPKTFRFEAAYDFERSDEFNASFRTWLLTRAAWEGSPARNRMA